MRRIRREGGGERKRGERGKERREEGRGERKGEERGREREKRKEVSSEEE